MSRTRNATEFRTAVLGVSGTYERAFRPTLDKLRATFAGTSASGQSVAVDESLEYHARCYIVNALLTALNWRLDSSPGEGLPNLAPEVAVTSQASGTRRFLDYLGFERATQRPLLVVEAKRLNVPLPLLAGLPDIASAPPSAVFSGDTLLGDSAILSCGLGGGKLSGDWSKWLRELKDYVRSVSVGGGEVPKRVVMTNGNWLIVFLRPPEAFLSDHRCEPEGILVYRNSQEIANRSGELFSVLEHQHVLDEVPILAPVELPFHVDGRSVRQGMHALRLRYDHTPGIYHSAPVIHVAPAVLLKTELGTWLRVEKAGAQFELPREPDHLSHPPHTRAAGSGSSSGRNLSLPREDINCGFP